MSLDTLHRELWLTAIDQAKLCQLQQACPSEGSDRPSHKPIFLFACKLAWVVWYNCGRTCMIAWY